MDNPLKFKSLGENTQIFPNALILHPELISIQEGTRIDDMARIEGGTGVEIGKYVHISSFSSLMGGGKITLGDYVGIGQGARIISGRGHPFEEKFKHVVPYHDVYHRVRGTVVIEDHAFVGVNAVVMPNVVIGMGAVVGANSVVTKDVPPWAVVVGSPAKIIGYRDDFVSKG